MKYPFTAEQFIGVFSKYNTAVWPIQILFYVLAAIIIFFVFRSNRNSSRIISAILAFFWLWMGIVYHWLFFTSINPAAKLFGVVFVVEGLLFIYYGIVRGKISFSFKTSISSYTGLTLAAIGLVIYPIVGYVVGHTFPNNPTFGLPCPTTIFTLGMLLLSAGVRKRMITIPFLWSIVGFMAAISFGIKEDVLLLLSGITALILVLIAKRSTEVSQQVVMELNRF